MAFQQWQEQTLIAQEMKAKAAVIIGRLKNSSQVSMLAKIYLTSSVISTVFGDIAFEFRIR